MGVTRRLTGRLGCALAVVWFTTLLPSAAPAAAYTCATGPITGQGSEAQYPVERDTFIPAHVTQCPGTAGTISYQGTGQAAAVTSLFFRQDVFVSLDEPLTPAEWAEATTSAIDPATRESSIFYMPAFVGGMAVTYNLSSCGFTGPLNLSAQTLSLVYSGVVTHWNDPALLVDNPGLSACSLQIAPAVRDGYAWSTAVLKDYLSKANPLFDVYKRRDLNPAWPPLLHATCQGPSEPAMAQCATNDGAIAYMEYKAAFGAKLPMASMENGNEFFVAPAAAATDTAPTNCTAALGGVTFPPPFVDWSTVSLTDGSAGYPICGFSYEVTYQAPHSANPAWGTPVIFELKDHLTVILSAAVQDQLAAVGYVELPQSLRDAWQASVVDKIVTP